MTIVRLNELEWATYGKWQELTTGKEWISQTEVEDFVDGIIKEKAELYGINVIDLKREFRSVNVEFFLKIIEVFCCSSTIYVPTNDEFEELQKMLFVPVCDKT